MLCLMISKVFKTTIICPSCDLSFASAKEAADIIGVSYSRLRAVPAYQPEQLSAFKVEDRWLIPHRPRKTGGEVCQ